METSEGRTIGQDVYAVRERGKWDKWAKLSKSEAVESINEWQNEKSSWAGIGRKEGWRWRVSFLHFRNVCLFVSSSVQKLNSFLRKLSYFLRLSIC